MLVLWKQGARAWASREVRHITSSDVITAIVVTELISNAVMHVEDGEGRDWVVLRVVRGSGSLRVEVIDPGALDGDGPHVVRQPSAPDPTTREGLMTLTESGRGLHIVKTHSRAWGTYLSGQRRVVWADLPYPAASRCEEVHTPVTHLTAQAIDGVARPDLGCRPSLARDH
ncbi:ATP-binding protein [Nonomuraea sp. NPDC050680]|uniref:ATP-binding protein n=1 Tax=Nonomuraea sp. NPDC050680 TaxID=3154630 RepID=UPI0033DBB494